MLELKTYKNWKEICEIMNWSTTGGNTKKKYLKQLDAMCKYHKEGNKIVIDEIYSKQKKVQDNRENNGANKYKEYFHTCLEDYIYINSKDSYVYEEGYSKMKEIFDIKYLGLSEERIQEKFEKVKKEFEKSNIKAETFDRWKNFIISLIKTKSYSIFSINIENFKKFNTKVELSIVVQEEDNKIPYVIKDTKFIEAFNNYKKKFAEENDIKMFGKINFGGCNKQQYEQCVFNFLTNKEIIEKFKAILVNIPSLDYFYHNVNIEDIEEIKKIIIIEKPLNYEYNLSEADINWAKVQLGKAIRETLDNNIKQQIENEKKKKIANFTYNEYYKLTGFNQRKKKIKQIEKALEKQFRYSDEIEFKLRLLYKLI